MATDVVSSPVEAGLTLFLVQVFIILILVRALASLLKAMHQPVVIGEILAGVLLGPSLFGQIPGFTATIFPPESLPLLKLISSVALIFFMFFLGMELEVSLMMRTWKSTAPTAVVAFFVSFFVGIIVAPLLATVDNEVDSGNVGTVYRLFVGMSFAFSAFPVLARVLSNHKLLPTTLGIQALSCAAVDDIVDWVVLALSLSYAAHGTVSGGIYTALIFICFVLAAFLLVQPALGYVHRRLLDRDDELNKNFIALIFLILLVMCWMTQVIGVQAFFGAFICGVIVPRQGKIARELSDKIEFLIVEFFLPLYFAYSGIFTDITKLDTVQAWIMVLVMSGFASAGKVLTCCVMTRLASGRFGWEEGQRTLEQIYNDNHKQTRGGADSNASGAQPNAREHRLGSLLDSAAPSSDSADAEIVEHFVVGNAHGPLRASQTMESASSAQSQSVDGSPVAGQFEMQPLQQYNASVHGAQTSSPLYDQRSNAHADSGAPSIVVDLASSDDASRPPSPTFFQHTPGRHSVTDWFGFKRYEPAPWDACWALGLLMNTRGLVALIVLNVALENGYLSITSFTILLLMALFTTFLTSPLLFVFYTRTWNKGLEEAEAEAEAEAMAREFMKPLESGSEAGSGGLPKLIKPIPLHEWKQPFDQLVSLHCIPVLPRARTATASDPFFLGASTAAQRPASPPSVAKWLGQAEPTEWQGPAVDGYEQRHDDAEQDEEHKISSPSQRQAVSVSVNPVRFHVGGDDSLSPASRAPPASARSAATGSAASASQAWNRSTPTAADLSSRSGGSASSRFAPRDRDSSGLAAMASRGVDRLLTGLFPASKPFGSSPALARQQSAAAAAAAAAQLELDAGAAEDASSSALPPLLLSPTHGRRASSTQLLPSLDPRSLQIPNAAQLEEAAKMRRHVRKRMQDKANRSRQRVQNRQQQQQAGAGAGSSGATRED